MPSAQTLEDLYQVAIDNLPFANVQTTGYALGDFETVHSGTIEYAEEYTFEVGKLLDDALMAGGWIELRQDSDDEEPIITGFFGIARNGDWEDGRILPETIALQASYDLEAQTWEFWLDQF